jgi:hypothetical protein
MKSGMFCWAAVFMMGLIAIGMGLHSLTLVEQPSPEADVLSVVSMRPPPACSERSCAEAAALYCRQSLPPMGSTPSVPLRIQACGNIRVEYDGQSDTGYCHCRCWDTTRHEVTIRCDPSLVASEVEEQS